MRERVRVVSASRIPLCNSHHLPRRRVAAGSARQDDCTSRSNCFLELSQGFLTRLSLAHLSAWHCREVRSVRCSTGLAASLPLHAQWSSARKWRRRTHLQFRSVAPDDSFLWFMWKSSLILDSSTLAFTLVPSTQKPGEMSPAVAMEIWADGAGRAGRAQLVLVLPVQRHCSQPSFDPLFSSFERRIVALDLVFLVHKRSVVSKPATKRRTGAAGLEPSPANTHTSR